MRTLWLTALTVLVLAPALAGAHALGIDYQVKNDTVHIEAYYDDDTPAHKAKVVVVNLDGATIADGVTDKDGKWNFKTPAPGKYEIRVDAGAGHRAKKTLTIREGAPTPAQTPAPSPDASSSRDEMTRVPWLRVGFGLSVIAIGSLALTLGLALYRQGKSPHAP